MQRLTHSPTSYVSHSGPVAAGVFEPPPQQRMFLSLRAPCSNSGMLGVGRGNQSRCGICLSCCTPRLRAAKMPGVMDGALPLAGSVGLGLELQCECR